MTNLKKIQTSIIVQAHPYPFQVLFCFNCDDKYVANKLKRLGVVDEDSTIHNFDGKEAGRFVIWYAGINVAMVRLCWHPNNARMMAVLAHEIFHVVVSIMDHVGVKLNLEDSQEAYAYLTGYLMEEVLLGIENQIFK